MTVVVVVVVVTVVAVVVVVVVVVAAVVMEGACVAVVSTAVATVVVVVVTPAVAEVTDNCDTVEETACVAEILAAVVVYVTAVSNVDRVVCSVVVVTFSVVWEEGTPVLCDTADDDSENVSSPQAHRLISIPTNSTNTNTRFIRIPLILHIDTPIVALIFKKVKTKFSDLFTITSHCYTTNRV